MILVGTSYKKIAATCREPMWPAICLIISSSKKLPHDPFFLAYTPTWLYIFPYVLPALFLLD